LFNETYERMDEAIAREKQIKGGSRAKKMALIEAMNRQRRDPRTLRERSASGRS
jgi:predicted GIY-YIG superfamily endonuclease